MELQLKFKMNEQLFLRNPEDSELGRKIVKTSVEMIHELGFEAFTFKKLAIAIETTEASVYRYFENKHKLLVYLVAWYWSWLEYKVMVSCMNTEDPEVKIKRIVKLLVSENDADSGFEGLNQQKLYNVVISEGSKAYLTHHVNEDNQARLFKPYKDLSARISSIFKAYSPRYKYTRSLSSALLEMAHYQVFFMHHLPSLTDFGDKKDVKEVRKFLEHFVFSCLSK